MIEIEELIERIRNKDGHYASQDFTDIDIESIMIEYADYKLNEFKDSDGYHRLLADSDWLRCLQFAGVDNWEGYDYAKDLLND
jgi:hypothetical protein